MNLYFRRILSTVLLLSFIGNATPMFQQHEERFSGQKIQTLLNNYKAQYQQQTHSQRTTIQNDGPKNKGAVIKALFNPKIILIVVIIAGLYFLFPMIDNIIPETEICLNQPAFSNNTLLNQTELNQTNQMLECKVEKDETLSSIFTVIKNYMPYIIASMVFGTVSMIYADVNAICPIPRVTLDKDVIGINANVMETIKTYIEAFKNPQHYSLLGAQLPKGLLLAGPAGTGKTLIARAIAGETKKAFFDTPATSFTKAADIEAAFKRARKFKPCVFFIDEIDTIGGINRGLQAPDAISGNKIAMLNQFLVEFSKDNTGIMIIAATNYPHILDGALTRSGRFDNIIEIPKPTFNARIQLLLHYMFKLPKLAVDTIRTDFIAQIAEETENFTASDFENLVNQAALKAGSLHKQKVDCSDIQYGLYMIMGNKKILAQSY